MQELSKGLREFMEANPIEHPPGAEEHPLRKIANDWTLWALDSYRDELLTAALGISTAILTFIDAECVSK